MILCSLITVIYTRHLLSVPQVILAALAAVAAAFPADSDEVIPILRDDRVHQEDGTYNVEVETGNGITLSQSGSPDGPDGAVVKSGSFS